MLGPHPPGEQVLLLVQNLHYIVYLLKVAAMWRRVWSLATILQVSRSFSLSMSPLDCVPVEGGRHVEEGLELGPLLLVSRSFSLYRISTILCTC